MSISFNDRPDAKAACKFINSMFQKRGINIPVVEIGKNSTWGGVYWEVKEIKCEKPK